MLKSFVFISLLTTAALAQSSSVTPTPAPSPAANPLIPSGISKGCTDFLNALNGDQALAACTSAMTTATSGYAPGGSSLSSPSASQISSTLNNLCSNATATSCPESLIRGKIAEFYSACPAELTSNSNSDVVRMYNVLYAITPLKTAICSKDESGAYCAAKTKLQDSSNVAKALATSSGDQTVLTPNMEIYRQTNLLFLFMSPSTDSTNLCTACTRSTLTAYINFESNVPYAPGMSGNTLLGGQSALYASVQTTCGPTFLSGVVKAAGGLSGGAFSSNSGAIQNIIGSSQSLIVTSMSLLALAASVL